MLRFYLNLLHYASGQYSITDKNNKLEAKFIIDILVNTQSINVLLRNLWYWFIS